MTYYDIKYLINYVTKKEVAEKLMLSWQWIWQVFFDVPQYQHKTINSFQDNINDFNLYH